MNNSINKVLTDLRNKWFEVPAGSGRSSSKEILSFDDDHLLNWWLNTRKEACEGDEFSVRGWYHLLYKDVLRGKKVLDVGSGLGIDGITFAQNGAKMTFLDIVEENLAVIRRLCRLMDIKNAEFCYLNSIDTLASLPSDFDVVWCQGSMINASFELMREESKILLEHLPTGGRWIELAYPKERWEREGNLPFSEWGKKTDGELTPWVEWYNLDKLLARLDSAKFDVVFHLNFHDNDFNWFDLRRKS
ncbi:MAG: class I SAM-dependent methyltransferase [Bacteroidetes bacterium]|nr:class I SAM-dependent methyltransferase [Bacteroidota bacterium]